MIALAYFAAPHLPRPELHPAPVVTRPVENMVELQIALARLGFSPGSIDGLSGEQTRLALLAFQEAHDLPLSGIFDPATAARLQIEEPVFAFLELSPRDFSNIAPPPQSWRARGQLDALRFNSILEMVAEYSQSHPDFIRQLNPGLEWHRLAPGDQVRVPRMPPVRIVGTPAYIRIQLGQRVLRVYDSQDRIRFHAPVSIARSVDKRPSGELKVKVRVANPNYTFNPAILTEAARRESLTEKFIIQPGPNNPVGTVWIGLNLPSYGIHGTPEPEKVGRTESSGCFRLANWNAEALLHAVTTDMPVYVLP